MSVDVRGSIGALIRTRRAVRAFKSGMIPDADVNEILEAARWAPSPANRQPARFIWVKSSSIKRELQELAKESKELSAYWDPIFRPDGSSGRVNDLETPEVIAVLADPAKSLTNIHADNGFEWAAAMSIYAMWLRAHSLGYGGVFVQQYSVLVPGGGMLSTDGGVTWSLAPGAETTLETLDITALPGGSFMVDLLDRHATLADVDYGTVRVTLAIGDDSGSAVSAMTPEGNQWLIVPAAPAPAPPAGPPTLPE